MNISELDNLFQIIIGIVDMVKITQFSEMGMVTPSRPIYYLNLFDQLCQPCDSLKRVALLWHDETVCREMSTNNMKKRLEWKKCADSGTSEKSGSHGLYWGTRVPLPAFNSFCHTFVCSGFF